MQGGTVIGVGGFGCIFSPALVVIQPLRSFYMQSAQNTPTVTEDNRYSYVSKLGLQTLEEFQKCKTIIDRLLQFDINYLGYQSPGVFPIEYHDITRRHFEDIERNQDYLKKCESLNYFFKDRNIYSLVQVPLFTSDYLHLDAKARKKFNEELFKEAVDKLAVLHKAGIYHLDIKKPNIAIIKRPKQLLSPTRYNIYFNDWDLSFVSNNIESEYREKIEALLGHTEYYIFKLQDKIQRAATQNDLFYYTSLEMLIFIFNFKPLKRADLAAGDYILQGKNMVKLNGIRKDMYGQFIFKYGDSKEISEKDLAAAKLTLTYLRLPEGPDVIEVYKRALRLLDYACLLNALSEVFLTSFNNFDINDLKNLLTEYNRSFSSTYGLK